MTKLLRTGIVITAVAAMAGCMGHDRDKYRQQDYWKHSQVVSPAVIPSDIRVKSGLGFYPAPPIDVSGDKRPPSLVPPGSKIEYYQNMNRQKKKGRV